MQRIRHGLLAIIVLLAIVASACAEPVLPVVTAPPDPTATPTPTPAPTPAIQEAATPTPAPFENEPGLTADTIRIAVIADGAEASVGTHDASEQVWQAVEAWAAGVNAQGRLANRQVIVERIDAAVFRHADAIDLVCNGDFFAIVGSWATNDADGLSQLAAPPCAVPDFPARAFTAERLDSELTFVSNPINADTMSAGWAAYHARAYPDGVAAAAAMMLELPAVVANGQRSIEAATTQGYTFVHSPVISVDTDFSQEAQALIDSEARSLIWRNSGTRLLQLLAAIDEIDPEFTLDFIDCGQACYNPAWVEAAGEIRHPVHVWLPNLPIEEADLESDLTRYLFFMRQTHGDDARISSEGLAAWSAAMLFEEAVNRATGKDTGDYDPADLTRAGVVAAARTITEWDAGGIQGVANPAAGVPSPCFVVMELRAGAWSRIHTERRGEFDCALDNLVLLLNTVGGTPVPTPTPVADTGDEVDPAEPSDE